MSGGILPTRTQPGIKDHLASAASHLAKAATGALNAAAGVIESPAMREEREGLRPISTIGVIVSVALAIGLVAVAFFELIGGASALGFCVAGMGAFLFYDAYCFFTEMSHITESPARFQAIVLQNQNYQLEIMRACAQQTILLKHVVALF